MWRRLERRSVRWKPLAGDGLEHLTLAPDDDGVAAESVIIGERGGPPYGVRYRILCDAGWRVRRFSIETTDGRGVALASPQPGRWVRPNGQALPEFDGCVDIDLAGTPFTNTLPIRRLALTRALGPVALAMLYVPFDSFEPRRDGQTYAALQDGRLYRYEASDRSFRADLPLDEDGLVIDYPSLFRRA